MKSKDLRFLCKQLNVMSKRNTRAANELLIRSSKLALTSRTSLNLLTEMVEKHR